MEVQSRPPPPTSPPPPPEAETRKEVVRKVCAKPGYRYLRNAQEQSGLSQFAWFSLHPRRFDLEDCMMFGLAIRLGIDSRFGSRSPKRRASVGDKTAEALFLARSDSKKAKFLIVSQLCVRKAVRAPFSKAYRPREAAFYGRLKEAVAQKFLQPSIASDREVQATMDLGAAHIDSLRARAELSSCQRRRPARFDVLSWGQVPSSHRAFCKLEPGFMA